MMAVLYPGHTLAGESHLMYRDLAREDFIIMQPQGRSNDEAEEVLICYNKGGFIPNIVAREREVQTVLLEVSAGFGVAILPEYAVRHYRNARNLVVVPLLRADGSRKNLILRSHGVRATRIRRLKSCCSGWRRMSMWSREEN